MRYILVVISGLLSLGCSTKSVDSQVVQDLKSVPQNIEYFTKSVNFTKLSYINAEDSQSAYFYPWNIETPKHTLEDIQWAFKSYKPGYTYGENLQKLEKSFFNSMYTKANFDAYLSLSKRAITLSHLNIRAFPTDSPVLLDPKKAGEGFPFDYLQNSTLAANKPVFTTHYSKDKEWVHIVSSFTYGWVKTKEVVFLDKNYTDIWQKAQQGVVIKEGKPIYSQDGSFLFMSRLGTLLPLVSEDEDLYTLLAISTESKNKPFFEKVVVSKDMIKKEQLVFNKESLESIINQVQSSKYGWGGMYGQRDCSSMLRDIFIPFGIWLPRNSYQQSKVGERISLEGLSDEEKVSLIKKKAIPFKTLLYKKGHIMLYVGTYKDEVIVFHDTWGIKTKLEEKEGRIVIGKPVFSTLRLGSQQKNYDKDSELLRNLKSMNLLIF